MHPSKHIKSEPLIGSESALFFKRWLKNPGRLGTLAPISYRLADLAASCIQHPKTIKMVEIGAGPGRLTRALIKAGVKPESLKAVELDSDLCDFGKKAVPGVDFIQGDAQYLKELLPQEWIGHVDVIFSTIPFMCLPEDVRRNITEAAFSVLKPGGDFLHLTYNYWSPLDGMPYDQRKLASLWLNMPPAFIWRYKKQQDPLLKAA
ncbi:MAG: methyltransferase domain-containing protein [Alphaproteobacteria bacterium]|nr:methyltransferase domain-containing protein [Alphaproteobacteria bacterium]